jgi:hypothetical protein
MRFAPATLAAFLGASTVTLIAGCAGGGPQGSTSSLPAAGSRSWMLPQKSGSKSILVYARDARTGDVNVYDYANGEQVGTINEFIIAGCVDAKGDVYLVKFSGETVLEYAHGGTEPIKTYGPGGELAGCSVDSKGDVAITGTSPGRVTVYAKGDPNRGATYSNTECETQASMGYDNKRNIIGLGEYDSINVCAVLARAKQETTLTTSGITIYSPNGTMWDGKYIAMSDAEAERENLTGIYQATLSGTTLTSHGETILTDTCYRGYAAVSNPFILGTKNTPVNDRQGKVVVGSNAFCFSSSQGGGIEFWHYPKGGNPFKMYVTSDEIAVLAVSIGM